MNDVALLNPQVEIEAALILLQHAKLKLEEEEALLGHKLLKYEDYLQVFGAVTALRNCYETMEGEYRRMTRK